MFRKIKSKKLFRCRKHLRRIRFVVAPQKYSQVYNSANKTAIKRRRFKSVSCKIAKRRLNKLILRRKMIRKRFAAIKRNQRRRMKLLRRKWRKMRHHRKHRACSRFRISRRRRNYIRKIRRIRAAAKKKRRIYLQRMKRKCFHKRARKLHIFSKGRLTKQQRIARRKARCEKKENKEGYIEKLDGKE